MYIGIEKNASTVIDTAIQIHKDFGPGMLESVYEQILANMLKSRGLVVETQKQIDIPYNGIIIPNAFRLDLLINNQLIIEVKATEANHPVYFRQLHTYLKLMNLPLGLLLNFGFPLMKDGIERIINGFNNHD